MNKEELTIFFEKKLRAIFGDCLKSVYISDEAFELASLDDIIKNNNDELSCLYYGDMFFTVTLINNKQITFTSSEWAYIEAGKKKGQTA